MKTTKAMMVSVAAMLLAACGAAPARAAEPPAASSAGCLVTRQAYDSAGRPETGAGGRTGQRALSRVAPAPEQRPQQGPVYVSFEIDIVIQR